jgi:hypothetical protein
MDRESLFSVFGFRRRAYLSILCCPMCLWSIDLCLCRCHFLALGAVALVVAVLAAVVDIVE